MHTETESSLEKTQGPSTKGTRRWLVPAGVTALLLVLVLQLAFSTRRNSITWDEDDHIYAGYMSWRHGDFGLNPEHPPLVKLLGALPLLNMPLVIPRPQNRFFKLEAFLNGKDFLFKNDADTMLFRVRMAVATLTVLLALLVFLAAREMFGNGAGFIALGLLVFDPNLLAHGAVLGTDVGLSCFLLASIYAFYRYVKAPSPRKLILVGLAAGLALAAKHTAILICPMLVMLAIVEVVRSTSPKGESRKKQALRFTAALIVISVIAVAVLWGFYGFRYQARPSGMQLNPPLADFMQGLSRAHEVKIFRFSRIGNCCPSPISTDWPTFVSCRISTELFVWKGLPAWRLVSISQRPFLSSRH